MEVENALIHLRFIYTNYTIISIITKRSCRLISFLISLVLTCFRKSPSIDFSFWFSSGFKAFKASSFFIYCSPIIFICFSSALPSGEYVQLACFIIFLWLERHISSHVRFLLLLCKYHIAVFHYLWSCHQLPWLVFIFFIIYSFWDVKDCLMQEKHQQLKKMSFSCIFFPVDS